MGIIIDDDGIMHKVFTKADVVAMLTEIQLEIEEKVHSYHSRYCSACEAIDRKSVSNLIEQKINALKEDQEGKNEISVLKRT